MFLKLPFLLNFRIQTFSCFLSFPLTAPWFFYVATTSSTSFFSCRFDLFLKNFICIYFFLTLLLTPLQVSPLPPPLPTSTRANPQPLPPLPPATTTVLFLSMGHSHFLSLAKATTLFHRVPPSSTPLWQLSVCSMHLCLCLHPVCQFILFIRLQMSVRSCGICLSLTGLFHLA